MVRRVRTVIEPIPKAVETILHQVFRCSKVEPGIDCAQLSADCSCSCPIVVLTFVDDALEADHREQTAAHCGARNQAQDDYSKQSSRTPASGLFQELPLLCGSHVERKVVKKRNVVAREAVSRSFSIASIMSTRFQLQHRRLVSPTRAAAPHPCTCASNSDKPSNYLVHTFFISQSICTACI